MPWITATGVELEYPIALHAKIIRENSIKKVKFEDVMEVLHEAKKIHDEALRMSRLINDLRADNLRLTHENEFMLKLINEKNDE